VSAERCLALGKRATDTLLNDESKKLQAKFFGFVADTRTNEFTIHGMLFPCGTRSCFWCFADVHPSPPTPRTSSTGAPNMCVCVDLLRKVPELVLEPSDFLMSLQCQGTSEAPRPHRDFWRVCVCPKPNIRFDSLSPEVTTLSGLLTPKTQKKK
jgi:hypothetical protein